MVQTLNHAKDGVDVVSGTTVWSLILVPIGLLIFEVLRI